MLDDITRKMEKKAEELKKKGEEMADQAVDRAIRAAGKMKGQFVHPETRTENFLLWSKTFLLCSKCKRKFGPVDTEKWKEHQISLMQSSQLALGAVTGNPILIARGTVSVVQERGGMEYLKSFREDQKKETARKYLVQCEYCANWFCSGCWDVERNVCQDCAGKDLKSVLGLSGD